MTCLITMRSPTYAMKAKQVLRENKIPAETIKLGGEYMARGCTHGIRIDCRQSFGVQKLLRERGIPFSDVKNDLS